MQRIKNIEEVILGLKPFLKQFLEEHGTAYRGTLFQCPNRAAHNNNDNKPSAGFIPGTEDQMWHCFGCGSSSDIFGAYKFLEGKDINGANWYVAVKDLADKYSVPHELEPISAEEAEFNNVQAFLKKITSSAHNYLVKNHPKKAMDYIKSRGWEGEIENFQLGYLPPDNQAVRKYVVEAFAKYPELEKHINLKINKPEQFTKNISDRLIYPIKHRYGYILGLVDRAISEDDKGPKYVKHFVKSNDKGTLFNLNKTFKIIYLVEGASSVFTLSAHGIKNVVAMLGASTFTNEMYNNLVKHGIERIVFCYDGDKGGDEGLKSALKVVQDKSDIKVFVKQMPEGKDPDDLIKHEGVKAFKIIPEVSNFKYYLTMFKADGENDHAKKALFEIILSNQDGIIRERMLKLFTKETGLLKTTIIDEVAKYEKTKSLVSDVGVGEVLKEESALTKNIEIFEERAWRAGKLKGIATQFPIFDEKIDGLQTGLILIAGRWNVGKSAFMQTMALNLLEEPSNYILYLSIDDPIVAATIPRFIANLSRIPINTVGNPLHRIEKNETLDETTKLLLKKNRNDAIDKLKSYSARFGLKDSTDGYDTSFIEKMIKIYKVIAGDRKLIVFVDFLNMVNLSDFRKVDRTEQETQLAGFFKRMAGLYDVPVICTVEATKAVTQTSMDESSIKGSSSIQFRSDLTLLLSTNFEVDGKSDMYFYDEKGEVQPIVKVRISKNKMSGYKRSIYFKFYREHCRFEECDHGEQQEHSRRG